jgi:hypothetical protein|tara:strand:+ start:879 stop:1106 length:228 start_codon:yes stop_codon:yes gene_type:complete
MGNRDGRRGIVEYLEFLVELDRVKAKRGVLWAWKVEWVGEETSVKQLGGYELDGVRYCVDIHRDAGVAQGKANGG